MRNHHEERFRIVRRNIRLIGNILTREPHIAAVLHFGGNLCHLDHHLSILLQSPTTTYSGWNRQGAVGLRE